MNNNTFSQPTHAPQRSQQLLSPSRQLLPQTDHSALWDVPQHQSHVQAPPAPACNPQWTIPSLHQSVLYANYEYGQWQRPQLQYQQDQYPAQSPSQPAAQPNLNLYQATTGYRQLHAVASSQPQVPYDLHPQPQKQQQQKRLHHIPLQNLMPAKRQRLDGHNLNRQAQHHVPPPPPALNTVVIPDQYHNSVGDNVGGPDNAQLGANEEGPVGNRRGMSTGGGGTRGGSMSGNRNGIADRGQNGSYMVPNGGDGRGSQPSGGIHPHGPGRNFGGVASTQADDCGPLPNVIEPVAVPVAAQFQDAHGFNISGNPQFTNIGVNQNHNVNFYGGTHGLEKLENFVSFAALHDSSAQDPDRCCHPGTRENVLMQLRHWIDKPNPTDRIFWLHGPAGAGKSAIAQTIAHGYDQGEVVATFFFFRSDAGRNDGNRLFPTIAWQLAFSIPATKDFVVHALDITPHISTKGVETQFAHLVASVFQPINDITSQMRHPAPVVIIDGVDECSDEQLQRRILAVIGNTVKDCRVPIRFLISSRPEALIEETLNQFQEFTLHINLATLDDSNRDIEKFLVDKFSDIASKQGLAPTWPGQGIIEEIVFKSSGNFILASTLVRFISDEDYSAEAQLDIVRKLKPQGTMSPFALLDELYLEILKHQRDQKFLKTFLGLLVGRSSIKKDNLHEDDTTLMNVSVKELHIKLRRMRSLLKFNPFIDVYHKSFFDFLQDSSRSGQYYVSKQDGLKQYLALIVDSVVRHVSMAIEQPNCHEACHFSPQFKSIIEFYPPKIVLPIEDWQEALKPLLHLQDKLLKTAKLRSCFVTQIMRELQLHLVILQRGSHHNAAAPVPNDETVTKWSPALVTETMKNIPEKDLDTCLSGLLSCLQKTNSVLTVDMITIGRMSSLLAFDHVETVARVHSITNAQELIDLIDLVTNNECLLNQCGPDAARKAALLASEIFATVPLLPQSVFCNGHTHLEYNRVWESGELEVMCHSAFISRILDRNHVLPLWWICEGRVGELVELDEENETVQQWLISSSPNFVTRIRVMLEVARTIRYIHSMDVVASLSSFTINPKSFTLDSNLRVKATFRGLFAWHVREELIYGSDHSANFSRESNTYAFADLFHKVCFLRHMDKNPPNHLVEDARQLMEQCGAEDPEMRPTMENVVKEMETWNLT